MYCIRWWFLSWLLLLSSVGGQSSSSGSKKKSSSLPRRDRNLDHLDAETLSFYLGIDDETLEPIKTTNEKNNKRAALLSSYVGYDVAVLFYAQWCKNCHALAVYWDGFATKFQAGVNAKSKLVMSVFNCELNLHHEQLCTALGIQAYPTIMFIGAAPYSRGAGVGPPTVKQQQEKDKQQQSSSKTSVKTKKPKLDLPRTVFFRGQWVYTDSVRDWIRAMQGISNWHQLKSQSNLLQRFTNGIFNFLPSILSLNHDQTLQQQASKNISLPVGIPSLLDTGNKNNNGQLLLLEKELSSIQEKVDSYQDDVKIYKDATEFGSLLIRNLLVPINGTSNNNNDKNDAFQHLIATNGWNPLIYEKDVELKVIRHCVTELTFDYCSRLSKSITHYFLDYEYNATSDDDNDVGKVEEMLRRRIHNAEPYCGLYNQCSKSDFAEPDSCRPTSCPFNDVIACRYTNSCFDRAVQAKFARFLKIIQQEDDWPPKTTTTIPDITSTTTKDDSDKKKTDETTTSTVPPKKRKGWGFA